MVPATVPVGRGGKGKVVEISPHPAFPVLLGWAENERKEYDSD